MRPDDTTTILGEIEDIRNAPPTTDDATTYVLKSYLISGLEVWVCDHLGNWWRHPEGNSLTHWKRD